MYVSFTYRAPLFYLSVIGFALLSLTEQVYMSRIVEMFMIYNINSQIMIDITLSHSCFSNWAT